MNQSQYTQWGQPYPQYPPPLPPTPRKNTKWLLITLVSVALCIVLVVVVLLYSGGFGRLILAIEPSCTIGVTGSAATMTIEAWSANSDCTALVNGQTNFLGAAIPNGAVYLYTGTPTNPVVCELDDQGRHLIVRDAGMLNLVGSELCQGIMQAKQQQQFQATATVVPLETCTLQVTDHDMTMTITGTNANQDCNDIVNGDPTNFLGQVGIDFYDEGIYLSSPDNLPVVCNLYQAGRHITIRDDGGQYYGGKYCRELGQ